MNHNEVFPKIIRSKNALTMHAADANALGFELTDSALADVLR
jgi:hypothetical protein